MVAIQALEVLDAHGVGTWDDCPAQWPGYVLRVVRGALSVIQVKLDKYFVETAGILLELRSFTEYWDSKKELEIRNISPQFP